MRIGAGAAAGLLVALALAGCGAGGTRASSSAATSAPSPAATAPAGTASTGTGTGTASSGTGTGDTTTATAPRTATAGTSGSRRHGGKGPKGDGLPAPPAGLAQTAGYGTYERCQGTCTGSVPAALRRPLSLPTDDGGPCPITINARGPASPQVIAAGVGFHSVSGSQWLGAEVTWTVSGSYTGPLLIRGEMLGGAGALGFGTGAVPYDELQLLDAGQGAPRVAAGGRGWITYTRVRSDGCYGYEIDGTGFSEIVVFRAVA